MEDTSSSVRLFLFNAEVLSAVREERVRALAGRCLAAADAADRSLLHRLLALWKDQGHELAALTGQPAHLWLARAEQEELRRASQLAAAVAACRAASTTERQILTELAAAPRGFVDLRVDRNYGGRWQGLVRAEAIHTDAQGQTWQVTCWASAGSPCIPPSSVLCPSDRCSITSSRSERIAGVVVQARENLKLGLIPGAGPRVGADYPIQVALQQEFAETAQGWGSNRGLAHPGRAGAW